MPFDGIPATDNRSALVLEMMEDYLQGGARWMRGYHHNPEGRKCLLAAMKHVRKQLASQDDAVPAYLAKAIEWPVGAECKGRHCAIMMAFNDAPGRTYAEIEAVLHKAMELAANAV